MQQLKGSAGQGETQAVGTGPSDAPDLTFLAPPDQPDHLGRLGPYQILEVLGRGGMGVVFKAFDLGLQRLVAVKVLAAHLAAVPLNRQRFQREARSAAAVRHENVIAVHAVAEAGGVPYLVMEYVPGPSLQGQLDRVGPLPLADILSLGQQLAAGLAAAHAQGLIHRDLKPANVLLQEQEQTTEHTEDTEGKKCSSPLSSSVSSVCSVVSLFPRITDFGLARAVDDVSLTQSGVVAGTPQYMAPEQARGETLDHRADLFSLGSVLYALCTGQPPFAGQTTLAVLFNVCQQTPPPIQGINPAIPSWLCAVIAKLHARNPGDRFQSAAEVARLLGQYRAHLEQPRSVPAPAAPPPVPAPSPAGVPPWMGYEYRSRWTLGGWPLIHIATGVDPASGRPRIARGIIAIGNIAIGALALGGLALGGVALGGVALGGVALGGMAAGGVAVGGLAIGVLALGGMAIGYWAIGGGAVGVHAFGPEQQDPGLSDLLRRWFGWP
jgi:serine/threonine protein kinase